jgi:hypothetical protein
LLLAYADDVNILGGIVHTVKENPESLVVATKEIGLEVNADKNKYMIMSRNQNVGRSPSVKIDNSSIGRVEEFKYSIDPGIRTPQNSNNLESERKIPANFALESKPPARCSCMFMSTFPQRSATHMLCRLVRCRKL